MSIMYLHNMFSTRFVVHFFLATEINTFSGNCKLRSSTIIIDNITLQWRNRYMWIIDHTGTYDRSRFPLYSKDMSNCKLFFFLDIIQRRLDNIFASNLLYIGHKIDQHELYFISHFPVCLPLASWVQFSRANG